MFRFASEQCAREVLVSPGSQNFSHYLFLLKFFRKMLDTFQDNFSRISLLRMSLLICVVFCLSLISFSSAFAQETTVQEARMPFRIIGFGDSLMAGYRLDNDQSFPAVLERNLRQRGYRVEIVNAGVSGDTTTTGRARLDWSLAEGADLVILELGANDMLRATSPQITRDNLDAMLLELQQRQIPVLLAGMLSAPNMGEKQQQIFNAIYPQLAQKYALPLYPFFMEGVITNPAYLLEDGLHPNSQGVEHMVENFLPIMEKTLQQLGLTKR